MHPTSMISKEELKLTELQLFFARYKFKTKSKIPGNIMWVWWKWKIDITAYKKYWNVKYNWLTPWQITFNYDKTIVSVFPKWIKYIENWKREIKITAKKLWTTKVVVMLWWKIIWSHTIRIVNKQTQLEVEKGIVKSLWTHYIWSENWWVNIMKDEHHNTIIKVPYNWLFYLKTNSNTKLCYFDITDMKQIKTISKKQCKKSELKDEIEFDYTKTLQWILIFKTLAHKAWSIKLELYKYKGAKIWSYNLWRAYYPKDLKKTDTYYQFIITLLKNNLIKNYSKKYFAPDFELKETTGITWVNNIFPNMEEQKWKKFKKMTRLEFLKLISKASWILSKNTSNEFSDIQKNDSEYANILLDIDAKFIDKFWKKYFQPEKKILRKEAAYILYKLIKSID